MFLPLSFSQGGVTRHVRFFRSLFSIACALFQVPYPVSPVFATLTKTTGVGTNSSHSGTPPFALLAHSFRSLQKERLTTLLQSASSALFLKIAGWHGIDQPKPSRRTLTPRISLQESATYERVGRKKTQRDRLHPLPQTVSGKLPTSSGWTPVNSHLYFSTVNLKVVLVW